MSIEVKKLNQQQLQEMGVENWPVWEKEVSSFDWYYDSKEMCYFLEGDVEVETSAGEKVIIQQGDFAVFPKGLSCRWNVRKKVRKHYNFE
jgi:uncharacterized cupin superfamily protein